MKNIGCNWRAGSLEFAANCTIHHCRKALPHEYLDVCKKTASDVRGFRLDACYGGVGAREDGARPCPEGHIVGRA